MQLFEKMVDVVSQGSVRRGRFSPYLPIDHKDIKEFLEILRLKEGARNRPAEFVLEKAFVGLNPIGLGLSV